MPINFLTCIAVIRGSRGQDPLERVEQTGAIVLQARAQRMYYRTLTWEAPRCSYKACSGDCIRAEECVSSRMSVVGAPLVTRPYLPSLKARSWLVLNSSGILRAPPFAHNVITPMFGAPWTH